MTAASLSSSQSVVGASTISLPPRYKPVLDLLMQTPTGRQLATNPRLVGASIIPSNDQTLKGAYGMVVDGAKGLELLITDKDLPVPHLACILAHELTHYHDVMYSGGSKHWYSTKNGNGRTEVHAHFNQGRVLREMTRSGPVMEKYGTDIENIRLGRSTFRDSEHWLSREAVLSYLEKTDAYGPAVTGSEAGPLRLYLDKMWVSQEMGFMCDENWEKYVSTHPSSSSS